MTISEEELKKMMDSYGDFRHYLEGLKSTRQTLIDKVLEKFPEARLAIEEVDDEFNATIEKAEKQEKQMKKALEAAIDSFSRDAVIKDEMVLRSPLLTVSLNKEVVYDSVALDGRATVDPTLLAFRDEKIKRRITLNRM